MQAAHPWFAGELAFWLWLAGAPARPPVVVAEPYRLLLAGDWRGGGRRVAGARLPVPARPWRWPAATDEAVLEALALLDGLGARQTAQRLRRELRRRGNLRVPRGPIRATAANPAGLTARQVEVLALLAEGLTDAEIAARLSLSTKTVGHHVSAAAGQARRRVAPRGRRGRPPARGRARPKIGSRTARVREALPIRRTGGAS